MAAKNGMFRLDQINGAESRQTDEHGDQGPKIRCALGRECRNREQDNASSDRDRVDDEPQCKRQKHELHHRPLSGAPHAGIAEWAPEPHPAGATALQCATS